MSANDINVFGTIVGLAGISPDIYVAFKREPSGPMVNLGSLGFYANDRYRSEAVAINSHGDAVGTAATADLLDHAVLWKDGQIYDLNFLIPENSGWGRLLEANDISNNGCIVGAGFQFDGDRAYEAAFIMVPVVILNIIPPPTDIIGGNDISAELTLSDEAPFALEVALDLVGLDGVARLREATVTVPSGERTVSFEVLTFSTNAAPSRNRSPSA